MKFAGMTLVLCCATAAGICLSDRAKKKVTLCRALKELCNRLSMDMEYTQTPTIPLIESLLREDGFACLSFITKEHLIQKTAVTSPLSKDENEALSAFLASLGKSDVKAQLKLIGAFREYVADAEEKYKEIYSRDAKTYITFGIFFGVLTDLILL